MKIFPTFLAIWDNNKYNEKWNYFTNSIIRG